MTPEPPPGPANTSISEQRLSYKFQRLRERIRAAIASGELAGKLPGERELAKRFKVNTKTLSKALTDLAADGLVERNIGLGTFVRGDGPREAVRTLVIHGDAARVSGLLQHVDPAIAHLTLQSDTSELTPAMLARFDCIVVASERVSDELVRDMVVRGKRVITIGNRQAPFATRAIMIDEAAAAATLAQRLSHRGHRRLMLIGYDADGEIRAAIQSAIADPALTLGHGQLTELHDALRSGTTGLILTPSMNPQQVIEFCHQFNCQVPAQVSVLAIGWGAATPACSGAYVAADRVAAALTRLIEQQSNNRPITLWLSGTFSDAGTLAAAPATGDPAASV